MATVAEMVVNISARTSGFEKAMNNASDRVKKFGKGTGELGKKLSKNLTAPIGAAGGALVGLTKNVADNADRIAKTARQTGLSAEEFQKLEFAAGQAGLSQEQFSKSAGRLNTRIGKAAKGNEKFSEAFSNIGLELRDGEGNLKSTNDVFTEAIDRLATIEDKSLRAEAATEIFGQKAGRDMASLIAGGSEGIENAGEKLEEFGIISQEDAERAEAFNDSMDDFQRQISGAFQELAVKFLPKLQELIPVIRERVIPAIQDFIGFIEGLITKFQSLNPDTQRFIGIAVAVVAALGPILIVVGKIISLFGVFIQIIKGVGTAIAILTSPVGLIILAILALIAVGFLIVKNWDTVKQFLIDTWSAIKEFAVTTFNAIVEFFKKWGPLILAILTGPIGLLVLAIVKNWDKIKDKTIELWNKLKTSFSDGVANVKGFFNDLVEKGETFVNDFVEFFESIPGEILAFGTDLYNAGKSIIDSLISGIEAKITDVKNAITGIGDTIAQRMPFSDAEKGPLSKLSQVDFSSSLLNALERDKPMIQSELSTLLRLPQVGTERPVLRDVPRNDNGMNDANNNQNGVTINLNGNIQIRDDEDIDRLAERLFRLQQDRLRGRGVL